MDELENPNGDLGLQESELTRATQRQRNAIGFSGANRVMQRPWSVQIRRSTAAAALRSFGSRGGR